MSQSKKKAAKKSVVKKVKAKSGLLKQTHFPLDKPVAKKTKKKSNYEKALASKDKHAKSFGAGVADIVQKAANVAEAIAANSFSGRVLKELEETEKGNVFFKEDITDDSIGFIKPEFEIKPPKKEDKPVEEAAPLDPNAPKLKESRPYILKVRNISMDTIYGFSINNIRQALKQGREYDERVIVEYGLTGYSYEAFLSHFVTHPTKIGRIRYQAFHGYELYRQKQLSECYLTVIHSDPDGHLVKDDIMMYTALNQMDEKAVEKEVDFEITDRSWDIKLNLYPEAEVLIHLFPALSRNVWSQELEYYSEPQIGMIQTIKLEDADTVTALKGQVKELEEKLATATKPVAEQTIAPAPSDAAFTNTKTTSKK